MRSCNICGISITTNKFLENKSKCDRCIEVEDIINMMISLDRDKRLHVLSLFCFYCGGDMPCQCGNDE